MSLPGDTFIEKLFKAKAFHRQLSESPRLRWLSCHVKDANGKPVFDPVRNFDRTLKEARKLSIMRAAMTLLATVGYYRVTLGLLFLLVEKTDLSTKNPSSLNLILMVLSLCSLIMPVWLVPKAIDRFGALFEAWAKDHWLCPEFGELVAQINSVGPGDIRPLSWMECNGVENVGNAVPAHVIEACDERLLELALMTKESEMLKKREQVSAGKSQFNGFFLACRRLGILKWDADPRPYWEKASTIMAEGAKSLVEA